MATARVGKSGVFVAFIFVVCAVHLQAADHGDTPSLNAAGRNDAKITDLHVFTRDGGFVVSVCLNPAIPPSVSSYLFASDLEVTINIDKDPTVDFSNPTDMALYGGTLLNSSALNADVQIVVRFQPTGEPVVGITGLSQDTKDRMKSFFGLRDDPFIRGNRVGRNVAAIVFEIPLAALVTEQTTLAVWATSKVDSLAGPFQELGGRALRSMFPENDAMNSMPPNLQEAAMGVPADVVIFDTSRPAAFPNGRELTDDVVDLVGDPRVTTTDGPGFPSANDRPFMNAFPYLAPPHLQGTVSVPALSGVGVLLAAGVISLALLIGVGGRRAPAKATIRTQRP